MMRPLNKKGGDSHRRLFGFSVKSGLLALRLFRAGDQGINDRRIGKGRRVAHAALAEVAGRDFLEDPAHNLA